MKGCVIAIADRCDQLFSCCSTRRGSRGVCREVFEKTIFKFVIQSKMFFFRYYYVTHLLGTFLCPLLHVSHPQYLRMCRLAAHSLDYLFLDLTPAKTKWEILLIFGIFTAICFVGVANYHVIVILRTQLEESSGDLTLQDRSQFIFNPKAKSSKKYVKPRTTVEVHHEQVLSSCLSIWKWIAYAMMFWIMGVRFFVSLIFVKAVQYRNFGLCCICLGVATVITSVDISHEQRLAQTLLDGILRYNSPTKESFNIVTETISWLLSSENNKEVAKSLF